MPTVTVYKWVDVDDLVMELNTQLIAILGHQRCAKGEVLAHLPNKPRDLAPGAAYVLVGESIDSGPFPDTEPLRVAGAISSLSSLGVQLFLWAGSNKGRLVGEAGFEPATTSPPD
jgi:hypothetical protein